MIKNELKKIRPLLATKKMMKLAADDIPRYIKSEYKYYSDKVFYDRSIYIRCYVHNKILKTTIFFTENMRSGGRYPSYELFIDQEKRRFITYDRLHDKWREAKLDMLEFPSYFYTTSAKIWISPVDYEAVKKYLGGENGGYQGILDFQRQIRKEELLRQHKKETDPWDADLAQIPGLPKDWARWVDKVGIRENYIFYQYSKKNITTGYCSYCEKDVPIKRPRYNKQIKCPRCRHISTLKSVGKAGSFATKRYNMFLIQRSKDGFVIRQFEGFRKYFKDRYSTPDCAYYEIRRSIHDSNGKALRAYYWGMYKQRAHRWIASRLCNPGYWFNEEGKVYGKTLPDLSKNELSRTGLIEMLKIAGMIDPEKYLAVLKEVPQMEKLAKVHLTAMVTECLSRYDDFRKSIHNVSASSLTEILGINFQELKRLRENNGDTRLLSWLRFENETQKIIEDDIIKWFCSEKITPDDIKFIQNKMNAVQIYNYLRRQMSVYKKSVKDIITTWADYLSMAKSLKMDTNDEIIYRVNKLYRRHDELVERCHEKDVAVQAGQILEKFPHVDEIFESIKEKYEYSDNKYAVLVPDCLMDILFEGRNLHHCIANSDRYWERIERRETYILFLRRSSDVKKSFYTLEIEPNGTIRQKRTMYDRQEPDIEEAKPFLEKWQAAVTKRLTNEDRKLAEESRVLRHQSYAQLKKDQVIIHTGALRGQLLVDVLLADLMENAAA